MSLKALSDYTIYSKYAHYLPEKKRRETWDEITDRVFDMHARKYAKQLAENEEFKKDFEFAKEMVRKKRVLGSQRALQFGGKWIEDKNLKLFNCVTTYIDRPRVFQEIMYTLLCGAGMGFSVQKHHINKLPEIFTKKDGKATYVIPDSIEGWSDAVGVLIASYLYIEEFKEFYGKDVSFDYSLIRPEGALIAGQFKAPGHHGLEKAIEKIRKLIDKRINSEDFNKGEFAGKLKPINAYDVIMYGSDAVISGGLRRSATVSIFSIDDIEMLNSKTSNWFVDNPQRGRSNNSVALIRGEVTREQFSSLMKSTKEFGEPGFIWLENKDIVYNPCQPSWATVLTPNGLSTIGDIKEGDFIWSESGWTKVEKKWSTGIKEVFRYRTTSGVFYGTENHRVLSRGKKIEVKDAASIDSLRGRDFPGGKLDTQDVIDGIVFGDGSVHAASNDLVYLCVGKDDFDYTKDDSEIKNFMLKYRPGVSPFAWEVKTTISAAEIPKTYLRSIPNRFINGSPSKVAGFLRGLYTANGSVVAGRVTLKTSSSKVVEQIQIMLSSLGIRSYYTTNKKTSVEFSNGTYECKESYDVNIMSDRQKFLSFIGFVQSYKNTKLIDFIQKLKNSSRGHSVYDIISSEKISKEEVFDITVDNDSHTYWSGGVNISNCCEIGMMPSVDGQSGLQGCNLVEINGKYSDSKERFHECCRAAGIIGTLQAGYTDFKYIDKVSKEIFDKEALLGCSITGIMDNPDILLDKTIQKKGAEIILEQNEKIAKVINVNKAARATCVKPAGSTSCVLQTASGIHPHHAKRYIRRVQANRNEFPMQWYQKVNPNAVEKSVWSANDTDFVVSFLCEVPKGAKLKNDISAVDFLAQVKLTQNNWVEAGTRPELGTHNSIRHNVSVTAVVKDNEWKEVEDYIFKNQKDFAGISLLPASGDLDYSQAPFATVLTPEEIVREYGDGSILASGLVVDGLHAFEGNLWKACDIALGYGETLSEGVEPTEPHKPSKKLFKSEREFSNALANYAIELNLFYQEMGEHRQNNLKIDWVRRAKQFADRYFNGDLKRSTYCLKHVSLWHTWLNIKRNHKEINWANVVEETQDYVSADTLAAQACAGGKCAV